jgi:hypothetical protein
MYIVRTIGSGTYYKTKGKCRHSTSTQDMHIVRTIGSGTYYKTKGKCRHNRYATFCKLPIFGQEALTHVTVLWKPTTGTYFSVLKSMFFALMTN